MTMVADRGTATSYFQKLDDEHRGPAQPRMNVGGAERWLSTVAGSALVLGGLSRGSMGGILAAVAGAGLLHRGMTGHCELYKALDMTTADPAPKPSEFSNKGIHVEESFTINKSAHELYEFWHNFENLPKFLDHVREVKRVDDKHTHWKVDGPAGSSLQWTAETISDEPDKLIAWRSTAGADVDSAGSVRFVPSTEGHGTEVRVVLDYIPPAGKVGAVIASLFGKSADQQVRSDLRRFKAIMETGEVPTIDGQSQGR
jgi:uncharacterized membrane protein